MDVQHLVQMANRIGDFFEAMPDRNEAIEGVALHLQKFWEPRMRGQLLVWFDTDHAADRALHPLVEEAILLHRVKLDPAR
jgi:formate dehydrogenase subunit delta